MARKVKKNGVMSNVSLDKNKKYKYNSSGDLVEATGTLGDNEISISGSKSSLRRAADMERNISILATTLLTTDNGNSVTASTLATAASDATSKANSAQSAAISAAATDATSKANSAQSAAISTASSDATSKANAALASAKTYADQAEADAESAAASDATSKANAAQSAAASDATSKANAAQAAAISAAASDATSKANAARAAAVSDVTNGAGAAFDTLVEIQNAMATDAELNSAIAAITTVQKANQLTTARTISLGGDLSGSASFNGTSNITITASVADDSHNHTIANVDGLQTALNNKQASGSYASTGTSISAGNGLTGGGSFASSRTLHVGGGNGISISADGVAMSGSYSGSFTATGDITAYSDESLKTNIQTIDGALGKVEAVRGVTFDRIADGSTSTGVVAQELLAVLPEAVHTDADGVHSVAYGNITGLLIEALKELSAEVKELKK